MAGSAGTEEMKAGTLFILVKSRSDGHVLIRTHQ